MKNWSLNIIFLLFFPLLSFSQINTQTHRDYNGKSYDWSPSNKSCLGCASFYVKVERTVLPDINGLYYFYCYFYSNSFYLNGTLAGTYITGLNISFLTENNNNLKSKYNNSIQSIIQNKKIQSISIVKNSWILVPPKTLNYNGTYLGATLYGGDPNQIINIKWDGVVAY